MTNEITKLPRTKSYARNNLKNGGHDDMCECCGQILETVALFVVTGQGCYPVGADCAERCRAAGFTVEAAA
jgi:hypothetical protein